MVQSAQPSITSNGVLGTTPTVLNGLMKPPPPLAIVTLALPLPRLSTRSMPRKLGKSSVNSVLKQFVRFLSFAKRHCLNYL